MISKSIFLDPVNTSGRTVKELISIKACELKVIEQLRSMGYKFSNQVNLAQRAVYLTNQIAGLENQLKNLR